MKTKNLKNLKKLGLASLVLAIGSQAMAVTDNSTDLWVGMGAASNETMITTSPKNPTVTTAIGVNLGTGVINDSFGIDTYDFLVGYGGSFIGNSTGTYNMTNTTSSFTHGAWFGQTWTDNGVSTATGTLNMTNATLNGGITLYIGESGTGSVYPTLTTGNLNMINSTINMRNTAAGGFVLGKGATGNLNMADSTIHANNAQLGLEGGLATSILKNSSIDATNDFFVGQNQSTSNINLDNSKLSSANTFYVGNYGTGTITGINGSTITSDNSLMIGNSGIGTVNMDNSTVTAKNTYLGFNTGGNGTLNMKNGSTLTTNNLSVGEIGTGSATFTDSTIAITDFLKVGSSSGTGTVTLNNSDLSSSQVVQIGTTGNGTLTVGEGSDVTVKAGGITMGSSATSGHGTINFTNTTGTTFTPYISGYGDVNAVSGVTELKPTLGSGDEILTAKNSYIGKTTVANGAELYTVTANGFSSNSDFIVDNGGDLHFGTVDQSMKSLTNNGTFSFDENARTLTVGSLDGTGTYNFNTTLGDDNSVTDKIVVTGDLNGSGIIAVTNDGGTGAATVRGITLIDVAGANNGSMTLASPVQAGAYEYTLQKVGSDYNLQSYVYDPSLLPPVVVTPTKPVIDIYRPGVANYVAGGLANQSQGFGSIDSMLDGFDTDLGMMTDDGNGGNLTGKNGAKENKNHNLDLWGRVTGSYESNKGNRFDYDQHVTGVQVGQDVFSHITWEDTEIHAGIFADYSEGNANFHDQLRPMFGLDSNTGSLSAKSVGVGAYGTMETVNGTYVDGLVLVSKLTNNFEDSYGSKSEQKGSRIAAAIGGGIQLGQLGGVNFVGTGSLAYQNAKYSSFNDSVSIIDGYSNSGMKAKLGLKAYKNITETNPNSQFQTTQLYGTVNVNQDLLQSKAVKVDTASVKEDATKTTVDAGLGVRIIARGNTEFYTDGKLFRSIDGDRQGVKVTVGAKVTW